MTRHPGARVVRMNMDRSANTDRSGRSGQSGYELDERETRGVRVLALLSAANAGTGPAKGLLQLVNHLRHPGLNFEVCNIGSNGESADSGFVRDARDTEVRVGFVQQHGRNYLALLRQVRRLVIEHHIDIVQSHSFKPAVICCLVKWLSRGRRGRVHRGRVRWVCFMHGTTNEDLKVRIYHFIESVAQLFADRVVLVSQAQRQRPLQRFSRHQTRVIHNAVDTAAPVRVSVGGDIARVRLGLSTAIPLVVAVGRLSPEKGVDVLIDALARTDHQPPAHAVIVGDGPCRESLEARAARQGLADRVHFTGHVPAPGDYLLAADVVVLPSRSEGIPNVALETMALGRPLVATAVGGTPEVVIDGESGLLVPPNDPAALARAMDRVFANEVLARALGAGGERRVAAEFSIATRCARMLAVYAELAPRPLATNTTMNEHDFTRVQ